MLCDPHVIIGLLIKWKPFPLLPRHNSLSFGNWPFSPTDLICIREPDFDRVIILEFLSMEVNRFLGPTCVVKVNIKCCKACPGKLRKKLQKSHGVSSIFVDQDKDLVIVSDNIDPTQLVEAIKRIVKKNAEVLFYEKDSSLVRQKLNQLFNKISSPHHGDSDIVVDDIDEDNEDQNNEESSCEFIHDNTNHKLKRGTHGSHRHSHQQHYNVHGKGSDQSTISRGRHVFVNPSAATARGYGHASAGLPPARTPYAYVGYDRYPTVMYAGGLPRPPPRPTLPPAYHDRYRQTNLPPPEAALIMMQPAYNPYYKRRDPPTSNSIFHYFSDDNSDACTII